MLILAPAAVPDTQMAPELDQEERIQLAIKALRDGTIPSQRRAALLYNIPRTTVTEIMSDHSIYLRASGVYIYEIT
jgi:hypothetical protein